MQQQKFAMNFMYPQLGKHFGILGLLGFQQKEQVQKGFKRVVYHKKTKV